jgi:group I intron endonuclease
MPYAARKIGLYRISNNVTGDSYVGQSVNILKRRADHFNLLRRGVHTNPRLQRAFNKYGAGVFSFHFEVEACVEDLSLIEQMLLAGECVFGDGRGKLYNIAQAPNVVMLGRKHSEETKRRISKARRSYAITDDDRHAMRVAQRARLRSDPEWRVKLAVVAGNPQCSYAMLARVFGTDTSSLRKFSIRFLGDSNV